MQNTTKIPLLVLVLARFPDGATENAPRAAGIARVNGVSIPETGLLCCSKVHAAYRGDPTHPRASGAACAMR